MSFVRNDNVIQKLPSDTADHSLDIGILPWRGRRGDDFFRTKRPNSSLNLPAIAAIAISQQIARGGIERQRLRKLLRRPLGCGVRIPILGINLKDFQVLSYAMH